MAKVKLGKWEIEEVELEQQHLAARQQGEAHLQTELQAQQVTYDRAKEQLVVEWNQRLAAPPSAPRIAGRYG